MADLIEFECPCCGGRVEFDSNSQQMVCPYCTASFDPQEMRNYTEELNNTRPDDISFQTQQQQWGSGETQNMNIYTCNACGGEIIADTTTGASSCPYCGSPVVMGGTFSGTYRPDFVIPFKLDKAAAKAAFTKHLSGKKLLPKVFKDQNHIDEIKGVYVPFWLFDAEADANIRYRATRLRTWSDSNYDYVETSHYMVTRAGSISYENLPADGSSKLDDDISESVEPFDFNEAVDFNTAYLAGYLADKFDVDADKCSERVNSRAKRTAENAFMSTVIGYASVIPENTAIHISNGRAKYVLCPVWLMNTTWNDKKFVFAMNGQTGKFVGNLPMDKGIFASGFITRSLILAVIIFVLLFFFA